MILISQLRGNIFQLNDTTYTTLKYQHYDGQYFYPNTSTLCVMLHARHTQKHLLHTKMTKV